MHETILGNPLGPWVLVLLGIGLCLGVFTFLVGLLEKEPLTIFVPPWSGSPLQVDSYASAMNEAAAAVGFDSHGTYEHAKGGGYKVWATLWLSPERDIMALVSSGKLLKMAHKTTVFYSRTVGDRWLASSDEGYAAELSGLVERSVLYHADFSELLNYHRERIASSNVMIAPLSDTRPWDELNRMNAAHVHRRVELRLCRFVDPARTMARYTLTGACRLALRTQMEVARVVPASVRRTKIKRPGAPGYIPFEARSAARPVDAARLEGQIAFTPNRKHSGIGIASCVFAAAAYILAVLSLVLVAVLGDNAQPSAGLAVAFFGSLVCPLIGLVLAIAGLVQRNRKKLWSILGLIGSSVFLLTVTGCLLLA